MESKVSEKHSVVSHEFVCCWTKFEFVNELTQFSLIIHRDFRFSNSFLYGENRSIFLTEKWKMKNNKRSNRLNWHSSRCCSEKIIESFDRCWWKDFIVKRQFSCWRKRHLSLWWSEWRSCFFLSCWESESKWFDFVLMLRSFPDGIHYDQKKFGPIEENTILLVDTRTGLLVNQWANRT